MLKEGKVGEIRMISASFGFHAPFDPKGWKMQFGFKGLKAALHIPWPWIPNREGGNSSIFHISGKQGELIEEAVIETKEWLYGAEAEVVARNIEPREARSPAMSHADTNGT